MDIVAVLKANKENMCTMVLMFCRKRAMANLGTMRREKSKATAAHKSLHFEIGPIAKATSELSPEVARLPLCWSRKII